MTQHIQVSIVNPDGNPDDITGKRPVCYQMMELLSEYKHNSKKKSQEYAKFLGDKKSLIAILFGQCDEATQTKIALRASYTADRDARRFLDFIKWMRTVCFGGDDSGLSYRLYKQVVAIKSLNTYINNDLQDPHGYKEQVKIKYEATKAIVGKFPNGTAALMELLSNAPAPLDWAGYYALPEED